MRMGQGVRTGLGQGGITCVSQTQCSRVFLRGRGEGGRGVGRSMFCHQQYTVKSKVWMNNDEKIRCCKCRKTQKHMIRFNAL